MNIKQIEVINPEQGYQAKTWYELSECEFASGYSMLSEDEFYQIHNFCNHKIMQEFVRDNYPYLDEDACEAALTPQAVEELIADIESLQSKQELTDYEALEEAVEQRRMRAYQKGKAPPALSSKGECR